MSFWGKLGKIASIAAPIAAIPFTGGASAIGLAGTLGKAASVAGKLAPVIGGMAAGRAQGKMQQGAQQATYDRLNLDRNQQQNQALQQGFENNLRLNRMQLGRSAHVEHPRANVVHFFDQSNMPKLPEAPTFAPTPGISPVPQSGFMDKILGAAGPAAALAGVFTRPPVNVGAQPWPEQAPQQPIDPRLLPGYNPNGGN